MFRRATIRRLNLRLRMLAVWAMIPLAALNCRTVSGCIGPDGQFESACNTAVCSGAMLDPADSDATVNCGCSCCTQLQDKQRTAGCCRKMTCCSGKSQRSTPKSGEDSVSGKGCCQPVSQTRVVPIVIAKSEIEVARPMELLTVDTAASLQSLFAEVANHFDFTRAETCTAPDLVITLRKLVI